MNIDQLNKWLVLGANIGVLAGILFLAYELRLSRTVADAEGFYSGANLHVTTRSLIVENADLWHRGCKDIDSLTPIERVAFVNIVSALNQRAFTSWNRSRLGLSDGNANRWSTAIAISMNNFSGFRDAWLIIEGFGDFRDVNRVLNEAPGPWQNEVLQTYETLSNSEPTQLGDTSVCGR